MMKTKCNATGKYSFPSHAEAREALCSLNNRYTRIDRITGKRIKHHMGKGEQKRVYYCSFCRGYHLTHWDRYPIENPKGKSHSQKKKVLEYLYQRMQNNRNYITWTDRPGMD